MMHANLPVARQFAEFGESEEFLIPGTRRAPRSCARCIPQIAFQEFSPASEREYGAMIVCVNTLVVFLR